MNYLFSHESDNFIRALNHFLSSRNHTTNSLPQLDDMLTQLIITQVRASAYNRTHDALELPPGRNKWPTALISEPFEICNF